MQSPTVSNRIILGIVAFGVSFGLSLLITWDFGKSLSTAIFSVIATYAAALFVDNRRRNQEMLIRASLHRQIKEMEGVKSRLLAEVNQLEAHHTALYQEYSHLQHQITEKRNQRDNLNRDFSSFVSQKKQLEAEVTRLHNEIQKLENSKIELNEIFSSLNAEKRRLELNFNISRAEIVTLQNQISELQHQKEDLENSISLLNRLKQPLEEKIYELRIQIQELEVQSTEQNNLLLVQHTERENTEHCLVTLQSKISDLQTELQQLQGQVSLLQQERDFLQSQVWELLQQLETISPEQLSVYGNSEEMETFPFADLIESLDTESRKNLSPEWKHFFQELPNHEIQVLKFILEQDNPKAKIKQIAESQITMPNLLIDSVNERAKDIIGELIIETGEDNLVICQEHVSNVRKIISIYEDQMAKQASAN